MFRCVSRIAALLLVVVASTVAPAAAEECPFESSGTGVVRNGLYASKFEATHLGRSSLVVHLLVPVQEMIFYPFFGTLTSASGDELNFEFDEEFYEFDYQVDEAIWVVNATVKFTGGTGRFQDATGSADMTINFAADVHSFDFLIDGSIDY